VGVWKTLYSRAVTCGAIQVSDRQVLPAGHPRYPSAHRLLITADGGGSNGYRIRLWHLQIEQIKVSDEELASLAIDRNDFNGEWNYQLRPRRFQDTS
jgi:Rhodopirellula transposase DDE domain